MTTHTAGPWAFDGVRVYAPGAHDLYLVRGQDGREVARQHDMVALPYACGTGSADANGSLIAAAPTLLETLQAVWRLAETLDVGNEARVAFRDLIAAALDDAEGPTRQPEPETPKGLWPHLVAEELEKGDR